MEGQTVDVEDTVEKGRSVGIVQVDLQKTLADLRAEITQQIVQDGDEVPPRFAFVEKLGDELVEISQQEEKLLRVKDLVGKQAEILIVEKPAEITLVAAKRSSVRRSRNLRKELPRNSGPDKRSRPRNQRGRGSSEDFSDAPSPRTTGKVGKKERNSKESESDPEEMREAWYTSANLRRQLRQLGRERRYEDEEDSSSVASPRKDRASRGVQVEARRDRNRYRSGDSVSPRKRNRRRRTRTTSKSRTGPRSRQRRPGSSKQDTFRLPQLVRTSQAVAKFEKKNIGRLEKRAERGEENVSLQSGEAEEHDDRPATVRIRRERSLTEEVRIPQVSSSARRLPPLVSSLRPRSYSIDGGNSQALEGYFTPDSPTMDQYFLNRQPFSYSALNLRELEKKQETRYNNRFEMSKMERRVRGLLGRVRAIEEKIRLLKSIGQEHWRGRFYQLRRNVMPLEERAKQLNDEEDELQENLIRLFELKKPLDRYAALYTNDFQKVSESLLRKQPEVDHGNYFFL
ncbi:hypothetical protein RvY_16737 [Ramazzottius varieornatus]|uniref:Uncharacterized protein n=1 Tax=Ramazzottius varieornatus TaxID=947166 RepID=A0A1D1W253_RAMVA|nr:hypothetical protein RvY_16737 [Ramazzottius varieornatus]